MEHSGLSESPIIFVEKDNCVYLQVNKKLKKTTIGTRGHNLLKKETDKTPNYFFNRIFAYFFLISAVFLLLCPLVSVVVKQKNDEKRK